MSETKGDYDCTGRDDVPSNAAGPNAVGYVGLRDERSADLAGVWHQVRAVGAIVRTIEVADLEALLAEYDRTDTLGPILDPTAYRKQMANIPQWRDITRALIELRRTIARVEELEASRR
jgi:hypothetical protein